MRGISLKMQLSGGVWRGRLGCRPIPIIGKHKGKVGPPKFCQDRVSGPSVQEEGNRLPTYDDTYLGIDTESRPYFRCVSCLMLPNQAIISEIWDFPGDILVECLGVFPKII